MAGRFSRVRRPQPGGPVLRLALSAVEAEVLRSLVMDLLELLERRAADVEAARGAPEGEEGREPHPDALAGWEGLDVEGLLGSLGPAPDKPQDAVLARLFPDGYTDDADASADFRRFTEAGLRTRKQESAAAVLDCLEEVPASDDGPGGRARGLTGGLVPLTLDRAQAEAWLGTLNDLRLALGERLGVSDEDDLIEDLPAEDPRAYAVAVYDFLTGLQDGLVRSLPDPAAGAR